MIDTRDRQPVSGRASTSDTVAERPGARSGGSDPPAANVDEERTTAQPQSDEVARSTGAGSTGFTISSPLAALAHAEILRIRMFSIIGIGIAIVGGLTIPLLPGGYVTTRIFVSSIGLAIIGLLYLLYRTRTPATYHEGLATSLGWYVPTLTVSSAVPFFGPFSGVTILLVLGIFFNGLGMKSGLALATYLTFAAVHAVTGGLVVAGVMDDPGFIHTNFLSPGVQLVCLLLIQMILLATFIIARLSRRSSLAALSELERAVRTIAHREALLEEARDELRRAVGTGRGRFTDQTIGHYRLGDLLGRGAMGEVYQALDTRDDQVVAVKMLSHASLGNAQHVERFLRELRTAAALESPNIVRVLEVGETPLPHLVMERLRGQDLGALLRSKPTMANDKLVDLVRQVGAGITAAGAAGVIHRDLKPQNVFLVGTTWKILDFGVSRIMESGDTLTSGHVVGTPAYMAPEQARGAEVDHRTDLYALAAIAYRVLTGHAPFSGGEVADTLYRVVHTAPRRPSLLATLPSDVDLVLAIGLAKERADRFPNAAAFADALASALDGTLSESLRTRGDALVIDGAWATVRAIKLEGAV